MSGLSLWAHSMRDDAVQCGETRGTTTSSSRCATLIVEAYVLPRPVDLMVTTNRHDICIHLINRYCLRSLTANRDASHDERVTVATGVQSADAGTPGDGDGDPAQSSATSDGRSTSSTRTPFAAAGSRKATRASPAPRLGVSSASGTPAARNVSNSASISSTR